MNATPIDRLLSWAYVEELPKRIAVGGSGWASTCSLARAGAKVDESGRDPGFPAALGDADPDALLLERIVGGLGRCRLDWEEAAAIALPGLPHPPPDERAIVIHPAALLRTIAVLKTPPPGWPEEPDWRVKAERDSRGFPRALAWVRDVLDRHGRLARLAPAEAGTAGARIELGRVQKAGGGRPYWRPGAFCPVRLAPDPRRVAEARLERLVWHAGACAVGDAFNRAKDAEGRLARRHGVRRAGPPSVVAMPWALGVRGDVADEIVRRVGQRIAARG